MVLRRWGRGRDIASASNGNQEGKESEFRRGVIRECVANRKCVHANGADAKAKKCTNESCAFAHQCPFCNKEVPGGCKGAMSCAKAREKLKA